MSYRVIASLFVSLCSFSGFRPIVHLMSCVLIVHLIVFVLLFGMLVLVVYLCVISVQGGDVVESSARCRATYSGHIPSMQSPIQAVLDTHLSL
jgi:hypothetical protein